MGAPRMSVDHPSVVVIYHFYPHYRKPVVEALALSSRADFTFVGDDHEYLHSIEPATLGPDVRFRLAPTHHLFGPFMWQWGAIAWAVRSGFDTVIMHAVPHWPCTWIGGLLARMLGRRVFFWGHGYLSRPRGLKGLLRRLFYAVPTDHMVYSRLAKAYLVAAGWPAERVHVIWNSLDTEAQARVREAHTPERTRRIRTELFGESDTPVIICTSRLISMRRLDLLLEAVARLRDGGTAANVVLVGDGPERAALQVQAKRLGVRVHFEGACYDEARLGALIMSSNVTVSPGKTGLTAVHMDRGTAGAHARAKGVLLGARLPVATTRLEGVAAAPVLRRADRPHGVQPAGQGISGGVWMACRACARDLEQPGHRGAGTRARGPFGR